ncbi:hypothetical protein [Arthrobacter sp. Soil762]|uniref:hypothetical protein n=1 Tax=Arthrobacter sp. Soil762 TaxID=1736401 RepID=UPI0006FCAA0D|nr:hypothetical protein [Arthrobacter sp. Soil762]KRE76791.1 hypothetical protein ASG77_19375 [Arthrobacter sp. Soil762]
MANLQSKAAAPKEKAAAVKTAKTSAVTMKPQPHRFRLSVPAADEAVLMWMNLQDNPSLSVRMLIRESIERLGYVDVINRPVAQLPTRGRPVGPEEESTERERNAETAAAPVAWVQQVATPAASTDLDRNQETNTGPEILGIVLEAPTLVQKPAPRQDDIHTSSSTTPEPEQPSGGQLEVNDIFATLR